GAVSAAGPSQGANSAPAGGSAAAKPQAWGDHASAAEPSLAARMLPNALRALLLALIAFAIFGPLLNLVLWAFAEKWYFPSKVPLEYGCTFWQRVFAPRANAVASLGTSVWIALLTVAFSLAVAVPAGYALGRLRLPWGGGISFACLLSQCVA